jgi:uncharacterized protein (TIGR02117 family)
VARLLSGFFSCRFILIIFLTFACSAPTVEIRGHPDGENLQSVFVAHDRWHAGIVLKKSDIPLALLPEVRDFPWAEYLEFSWGDKDYFPAPDPGIGLALKAAFWSSGSVLHVVGFNGPVRNYYPAAEILEINLSEQDFQDSTKFISDTFSRSQLSTPADARPGLSPNARFYSAEGKFSIFRTCNTWVAEALSAAGLPINPDHVITAGSLSDQLRPIAMPLNDSSQ